MPSDNRTFDITWDKGENFLFRDHIKKAKFFGINVFILFSMAQKEDTKAINYFFRQQLLDLCQCQTLYFVKLKGTLAQHIIYKKQLNILYQKKL